MLTTAQTCMKDKTERFYNHTVAVNGNFSYEPLAKVDVVVGIISNISQILSGLLWDFKGFSVT